MRPASCKALAFTLLFLASSAAILHAQSATSGNIGTGFDINAMDKSADACKDFYQYACGNWMAQTQIPADKPGYDRFTDLFERNRATLRTILEKSSDPANQKDAVGKQIGDFSSACMDEKIINARGLQP